MKWVTRPHIRVNRTATAWLIRRFIDPEATFLFVDAERVAEVQRAEGAIGFDAPGATNPHEDARGDRKSTRLNSSHGYISYAVFCLKKKNTARTDPRVMSSSLS